MKTQNTPSQNISLTDTHKLIIAVEQGKIAEAKALLEQGAFLNRTDFTNPPMTPLHVAIRKGNIPMVKFLLNSGACTDILDAWKHDALHVAILTDHIGIIQRLDIIEHLIESGANVNSQNATGQTSLHIAVLRGNLNMVQCLLNNGADIHLPDILGNTPLHVAVITGSADITRLLISKRACINSPNAEGRTPFCLALQTGDVDIIRPFITPHTIKFKDHSGSTPFHYIAHMGHIHIVRFLLDNGAAIDSQDPLGNTPLHIAILRGNLNMVQCLLNNGARIDVLNVEGHTPLFLAEHSPNIAITQSLTNAGVSLNRGNTRSRSVHTTVLFHNEAPPLNVNKDNPNIPRTSALSHPNTTHIPSATTSSQIQLSAMDLRFSNNSTFFPNNARSVPTLHQSSSITTNTGNHEGRTVSATMLSPNEATHSNVSKDNHNILRTNTYNRSDAYTPSFDSRRMQPSAMDLCSLTESAFFPTETRFVPTLHQSSNVTPNIGNREGNALRNRNEDDVSHYYDASETSKTSSTHRQSQANLSKMRMSFLNNTPSASSELASSSSYPRIEESTSSSRFNTVADKDEDYVPYEVSEISESLDEEDNLSADYLITQQGATRNIGNNGDQTSSHMLEKQMSEWHSHNYDTESIPVLTAEHTFDHGTDIESQASSSSSSSSSSTSFSQTQPLTAVLPIESTEKTHEKSVFEQCVEAIKSVENSSLFKKCFEEAKIPVDTQDARGWTLLHHAIKHSKDSIATYLIGLNKSIIEKKDYRGNTPLLVTKAGQDLPSGPFNFIKKNKGNINAQNYEGDTLLHLLLRCWTDSTVSILHLIKEGIDVNIQDNEGRTSLHLALKKIHFTKETHKSRASILEALMERGADIHIPDRNGDTPWKVFNEMKEKSMYTNLDNLEDKYKWKDTKGKLEKNPPSTSSQAFVAQPINDIFTAVKEGNIDALKNLANRAGFNPNAKNCTEQTLLELAMIHDRKDVFALLINSGADRNTRTTYGDTPLHYIARQGYNDLMSLFTPEYVAKNVTNYRGRTPLHCAIEGRHSDIFSILIEKGSNVNAIDFTGKTCLHLILKGNRRRSLDARFRDIESKGWRYDFVKRLLSSNNVESSLMEEKDNKGKTPLHYAVKYTSSDTICALFSKLGSEAFEKIVDEKDKKGWTALQYDVASDSGTNIDFLVKRCGANIDGRDDHGNTFLHLAVQKNISGVYFNTLLEKGGYDEVINAESGKKERAYRYLNAKNNNDETVLISMLKTDDHHYHDLILHIIGLEGVDVNARDKDGKTALHHVARKNRFTDHKGKQRKNGIMDQRLEIIMKLVYEKHANTEIKDTKEKTPFDLCRLGIQAAATRAALGNESEEKVLEHFLSQLSKTGQEDFIKNYQKTRCNQPSVSNNKNNTIMKNFLAKKLQELQHNQTFMDKEKTIRESITLNLLSKKESHVARYNQIVVDNSNSNLAIVQDYTSVSSSQSTSYVNRLLAENNNSEQAIQGKRKANEEVYGENTGKRQHTEVITSRSGGNHKFPQWCRR